MKKLITYLFSSSVSTKEKSEDPTLRTRYYKQSFEDAWKDTIITLNKMPGYKLVHEEKQVGELLLEKKTKLGRIMDITVTLFVDSPTRTSVDIYSASRGSLGDLGANYRVVQAVYQELDRKLIKE